MHARVYHYVDDTVRSMPVGDVGGNDPNGDDAGDDAATGDGADVVRASGTGAPGVAGSLLHRSGSNPWKRKPPNNRSGNSSDA